MLSVPALSGPARADDALIAVASNFSDAAQALRAEFERESGHTLRITTGSTGRLYAQILHGAPFDALLAADQATPLRLEQAGQAIAGSRRTYALGRIALWSATPGTAPVEARLRSGDYRHFAIANPELAPYGLAARQALQALGLWDEMQPRLVTGENIAAAQAMIATGNAQLGMVPLSQFAGAETPAADQYWLVPADLHAPILQDAILTRHGRDNAAALAWLAFLASPEAVAIIRQHGYEAGE